jgi:hypothetical protein
MCVGVGELLVLVGLVDFGGGVSHAYAYNTHTHIHKHTILSRPSVKLRD